MKLKNNSNEITCHLNDRYIFSNQTAWNLFKFRSHIKNSFITRLIMHLSDEQSMYFSKNVTAKQIQVILNEIETTLTAWFRYNQQHSNEHALLYQEFSTHYIYQSKREQRRWTSRQRDTTIDHMYHFISMQREKHYLQLLLTTVQDAQSFDDIRTVDEVLHLTYCFVCTALRLLEDYDEWVSCFIKVVHFSTNSSLQSLFMIALMHSDLADSCALWNRFCVDLCDDLPRRMHEFSFISIDFENSHLDYELYLIAKTLQQHDKTLADFSLSALILNWFDNIVSFLIFAELEYDQIEQIRLRDAKITQLNEKQRQVLNSIVSVITDSLKTAHFFIHDSADIEKTFLYECLCHHFRAQAKIVLCVISMSIAAQLLLDERTSHFRFKISIVCHDTSICFITARLELVNLLKRTILIIWNEISMQHKHNFTIVNASLCNILQFSDVFDEISAILDENFAQITFVISRENRSAQINVSIRSFWIWNHLTVLKLHRNMRIQSSLNNQQFVEWINHMSYDFDLYDVRSLLFMIINHYETSRSFIDHVYSSHNLAQAHTSSNFFRDRAILCSHNDFVNLLNRQIMNDFLESAQLFTSIDTIENNDVKKTENISTKYLQTLELSEFLLS